MGKPKTIRVNLVQGEVDALLLAIDTAIGNARDDADPTTEDGRFFVDLIHDLETAQAKLTERSSIAKVGGVAPRDVEFHDNNVASHGKPARVRDGDWVRWTSGDTYQARALYSGKTCEGVVCEGVVISTSPLYAVVNIQVVNGIESGELLLLRCTTSFPLVSVRQDRLKKVRRRRGTPRRG